MTKKMREVFWREKKSTRATFRQTVASRRSLRILKIAWDVLHKEKPDLIISCGAAVAVPFFYIGKDGGRKAGFIFEVFDRIDKPTMTGKDGLSHCRQVCCAVGRAEKRSIRKAVNLGSIF